MKNPLVSICVVTYNQQQYIRNCLVSVVTQEVDCDVEVLVGDDGSSDATCEIIESVAKEFPGKITLFRHAVNLGPTGNYQFLIEKAKGELIAHLDGDDFWLPGKLNSQIDYLRQHRECVAVYSNAVVINDKGEMIGAFNNKIPSPFDLDFLLSDGNFLNHSSMVYLARLKGEILVIRGPFIDYRMHLRLAQHGLMGYTNLVHVVYRVGSTTSMISNQADNVRRLYLEALMDLPVEVRASKAMRSVMVKYYWGELLLLICRGHYSLLLSLLDTIYATAPQGTALRVLLYPFLRFFPLLRTKICGNLSQLKIYHPR